MKHGEDLRRRVLAGLSPEVLVVPRKDYFFMTNRKGKTETLWNNAKISNDVYRASFVALMNKDGDYNVHKDHIGLSYLETVKTVENYIRRKTSKPDAKETVYDRRLLLR